MTRFETETAGLDADQTRVGVEEPRERADRVRAAADTRDHDIGILVAEDRAALPVRLVADDALELAHHPRERMRTHRGTEAVVRALDARDPRAHRFVHRVLQRRAPRLHGHDLGAEQLHAPDVQRLALDVDGTHVHGATESEQRRRGRGRDAVLARAGLGDHPALAHAPRQQRLAEHVVDLVRTGVREVFALQQHAHAEPLREPVALGDGRGPARVARQQAGELVAERVVRPRGAELGFELHERGDERLRREAAAVLAEAAEPDRFRARAVRGAPAHRVAEHRSRRFGRDSRHPADCTVPAPGSGPAYASICQSHGRVTPATSSAVRSIARSRTAPGRESRRRDR